MYSFEDEKMILILRAAINYYVNLYRDESDNPETQIEIIKLMGFIGEKMSEICARMGENENV
jgi:hypothetical protein